jgi:hypothetical protein
MERFEPSTLSGPVFETGAYTVPPHRPVSTFARSDCVKNDQNMRGSRQDLRVFRGYCSMVPVGSQG